MAATAQRTGGNGPLVRQSVLGRASNEPIIANPEQVWSNDEDLRQKHQRPPPTWLVTLGLSYASIGVIFGDIGTSPLYTVSSVFTDIDDADENDVIAVISLIFWTLTLVVLFKYVVVVLQADDRGEGGTFALYTLICRTLGISPYGPLQKKEYAALLNMSKKPALARTGIRTHNATLSAAAKATEKKTNPKLEEEIWRATLAARAEQADKDDEVEVPKHRWFQTWAFDPEPIKIWFRDHTAAQRTMLCVAIISTSMVFGDGVFTPALSVVSAVSGLEVATDNINNDVVIGVSCTILVLLFSFQFYGTHRVAAAFSPIVMLWLLANAAIGIYHLADNGATIFKAFSPHWIGIWFRDHGLSGWIALSSVMLSVTGAEAMYSDLGHFDRPSVMLSFMGFVYPCLVLTYMGQGAYLINNIGDTHTAYWSGIPNSIFWPMIVLATAASIVASQALISACFSITKQAKVLGFMPKLKITFTNSERDGQIYVAGVNWTLMLLCVAVTGGFRGNLESISQAYGLTISIVMLVTDILVTILMLVHWRLSPVFIALFVVVFGVIDLNFTAANMTKVPTGGWVAIAIATVAASIMIIWWAGQRRRRSEKVAHGYLMPDDLFTFTTVGARMRLKVIESPANSMSLGRRDSDALAPALATNGHHGGSGGGVGNGSGNGGATIGTAPEPATPAAMGRSGSARLSAQQLMMGGNGSNSGGGGSGGGAPPANGGGGPVGEGVEWVGEEGLAGVYRMEGTAWRPDGVADDEEGQWAGGDVEAGGRRGQRRGAAGPVAESNGGAHGVPHPFSRVSRVSINVNHTVARAAVQGVTRALEPSREELALLRGEFNLALKVPGASSKPVHLLPGIGMYYASTPDVVPPVLCHVLRNLEAVHKINVFVSVRHLPIPHVDVEDRLLVRVVPGLPNMYQCISRYGYQDHVNHGRTFVNTLITAIIHLIEARAGLEPSELGMLDAVRDPTISLDSPATHNNLNRTSQTRVGNRPSISAFARFSQMVAGHHPQAAPGPVAEGAQPDGAAPPGGTAAAAAPPAAADAAGSATGRVPSSQQQSRSRQSSLAAPTNPQHTVELREISQTPAMQKAKSLIVPALQLPNEQRLTLDLRSLSKTVHSTSLVSALSGSLPAPGQPQPRISEAEQQKGFERLTAIADGLQKGVGPKVPPRMEDAALRVSALMAAASEGVVFYFGRTSLRMKPNSNFFHNFLYDGVYRTMLVLSFAESEAWRVPAANLCEFGMVLFV